MPPIALGDGLGPSLDLANENGGALEARDHPLGGSGFELRLSAAGE